jgi:endonuclease YncB( thermonuclease family)
MVRTGLVAVLAIFLPGPTAHGFCELDPGEAGRVASVVDGETVTLDIGLTVRLIGALPPRGAAGEQTRAALAEIALAQPVRLFYGGRRRDRHGRALAHVFVTGKEGRLWVQGRLVEDGLAQVYSFADARACVADLLEREAAARAAGKGLWGGRVFTVADGLDLETLIAAEHRFAIVEGPVHGAAEARGRVYLNFEADWRRDFTVSVAPRDRRALEKQGVDLMALKGRRIRVRGWIVRRTGPMIEADHAEQVEVVE